MMPLVGGPSGKENTPTISRRAISSPVSSRVSRMAACSTLSSASMKPLGSAQLPTSGGTPRWISTSPPSFSISTPTAGTGLW